MKPAKYFYILEGFRMQGYTAKRIALAALAARQGGYFTARQALANGYMYPQQHYHISVGNWERVARGVYRLRDFPQPERGDLITLSLLSHDRTGQPQAVVSHETALMLHDMGDANPARVHLTVAPGFRRQMPAEVILHRDRLEQKDVEEHDGFLVTTPLRTLCDIAASPTSWPYLDAAVRDALRRGMVRRRQLLSAAVSADAHSRLVAAVAAAEEKAGA
jgi:predicted transcriptional regulator of viral defense system